MAAVTQKIDNFLGGVSRQTDDKKLTNQLTECVNGYPDATFGLLKRPGMKHIEQLKKANGTPFNKSELTGAAWFFIDRSAAGSYIGAIKGSDIYVWTKDDGTFCTVTNTGSSYLTGTQQDDYHFRSIQDTTIITNKTVNTAMQAANTHVSGADATIKLLSLVPDDILTVTIQNVEISVTATNTTTFDQMLYYTLTPSSEFNTANHLVDAIADTIHNQQLAGNVAFSGTWYIESYNNSINIRRRSGVSHIIYDYSVPQGTAVPFSIDARGGVNNTAIEVFEDSVSDVSKLPLESFGGHVVQILNSSGAEDDYYYKFTAYDTTLNRGRGAWGETIAPDVSPGLDASTMPHALINTGATTFTFGPISWTDRLTGDDVTNRPPSFITVNDTSPVTYSGKKITSTFFYSNRFGFLSEDNVILSVSNDPYNFFAASALTQIDSDPVDLNVSSIRPVLLADVLPSPQGLLLFSERQQFQLYSTDGNVLTPSSGAIQALSNYEMASNIKPVDIGTTSAFVSRVPGYSKLFTMTLRDVEEPPIVVDISKAVLEWLPDTIDDITVSSPNSVAILVDRDTKYLYMYRYYNNGEEDLFQAWVKWELPGDVQAAGILNDAVTVISQQEDEYTIGTIELDELPSGNIIATSSSFTGNVPLDMATRPVSPAGGVDAVVYDLTNDITKIYVPYTPIDDKEAVMLLTLPTADNGTDAALDSDQGYWATAIERIEPVTGYRYFEVKGDFSGYADGIVVGYGYDLDVTLPKFYLQTDQGADFTASLTISRIKLSVGRTGAIRFKVKPIGSNEWRDVQHTTDGDIYQGDTNPVVQNRVFTLPIHQRNTNFELKVTSDLPYPVSLVSMTWEGNYSDKYYRRS